MKGFARTVTLVAVIAGAATAHADDGATDSAKAGARAKYAEGVALVKTAQWSDALATFEAAARLFPAPSITLNVGACERALGRYVRARGTLERAIAESARSASPLPESSVVEARAFITEIDRVLARATVTLDPPEAAIAVDGRPIEIRPPQGDVVTGAAGTLPPGPGQPAPGAKFTLVLDPGVHVFTLSRKGFTDAVVNRTLAPGATTSLELKLDLLPATLRITSTEASALVRVDDADVGPAPVDVLRPAGAYRVHVERRGFVPYSTQVTVRPGEEVKLRAALVPDKPSVLTRWWFWTGAAAVVTAGVVITYAATRPTPEPPPYDGGSAGWLAKPAPAGFHF